VDTNSGLSNLRLFAEVESEPGQRRIADGIKTDKNGNVYAATSNGLLVFNSHGGYILKIDLGDAVPTNLNWGEDGKTLFITARDKLFMIRTRIGIDQKCSDTYKRCRVLALVGGKYLNSEFTMNALKKVFPDSMGYSFDFSIGEEVLDPQNIEKYDMLIIFRDPVTYPDGFEPDSWNPQYHCAEPDTVESDPPIDFLGKRVKWFNNYYGKIIQDYVVEGGALLLYHHACYLSSDSEHFRDVAGAASAGHPPIRAFKVKITNPDHPITRGVKDFVVTDVQHYARYEKDTSDVFMHSINEKGHTWKDLGSSSPAGWAYEYGKGRICYLAPGHTFEAIWNTEYLKLQRNAARWLLNPNKNINTTGCQGKNQFQYP